MLYTIPLNLSKKGDIMSKKLLILGLMFVALGVVAVSIHGCGSSAATSSTTNPTLTIDGAAS